MFEAYLIHRSEVSLQGSFFMAIVSLAQTKRARFARSLV